MNDQSKEIITIDATPVAYVPDNLESIITRWLDVKSKSEKTREAYSLVMKYFRLTLQDQGLEVFSDLRKVGELASIYARCSYDRRGRVHSGKLAENTVNQRLAILSSFYAFCNRWDDRVKNPILLCEREKRNTHDAAAHFDAADIDQALQTIKRDTLPGKRDYALLLLALTTGRRAAELTALCYGDLRATGQKLQVIWQHCKGNKTMQDILGNATREALEVYLQAVYSTGEIAIDAPVFVALSRNNYGKSMSVQAVSDICKRYLGTSKVHATRHTFAVNSERAGASLSEIGERLGHASLKTTSDYMKQLHSAENKHVGKLESLYGL